MPDRSKDDDPAFAFPVRREWIGRFRAISFSVRCVDGSLSFGAEVADALSGAAWAYREPSMDALYRKLDERLAGVREDAP